MPDLEDAVIEEEEVVEVEDGEIPLFLQEEEDDAPDTMPVAAHLKSKNKLRGQIAERDDELEKLRHENEQLKASTSPQATAPLKRPRIADFDSDDNYEVAMDAYEEQRGESQLTTFEQKKTQTAQVERQRQQISEAVGDHYTRAEKLVQTHSIAPDVYKKADRTVRQAVASVLPQNANADAVVDSLINVIGEGSEKTMFHLGRNKTALNNFRTLLMDDPSGLKASVYLGRLTTQIEGTTKRKSQATAPAAQVNGDAPITGNAAKLKKDYDKQHKANQTGKAFSTKRAAKKAGIDTSKW